MQERHQCVDCRRNSPPTETGYTLISKEFGWRLTRTKAADGSFALEWRCPTCWQKYKAKQATRPWEPPRRPPPRIAEQTGDEERSLSQSGEYSRALYDEEFPPPSSRRSPTLNKSALPDDPVPPSRPGPVFPRKGS
jgi:hypothetical protein